MKLRILIIDDEESIRETFKCHLENKGHTVIVADEPLTCDVYHGCGCQEGYFCYDILFVDYKLPRMSGLDFIEMMLKRGCNVTTSNKFLMSGNITAIDMSRVENIGCNILQKPVTLADLDLIVEQVKNSLNPDRKLTDMKVLNKKAEQYLKSTN